MCNLLNCAIANDPDRPPSPRSFRLLFSGPKSRSLDRESCEGLMTPSSAQCDVLAVPGASSAIVSDTVRLFTESSEKSRYSVV